MRRPQEHVPGQVDLRHAADAVIPQREQREEGRRVAQKHVICVVRVVERRCAQALARVPGDLGRARWHGPGSVQHDVARPEFVREQHLRIEREPGVDAN